MIGLADQWILQLIKGPHLMSCLQASFLVIISMATCLGNIVPANYQYKDPNSYLGHSKQNQNFYPNPYPADPKPYPKTDYTKPQSTPSKYTFNQNPNSQHFYQPAKPFVDDDSSYNSHPNKQPYPTYSAIQPYFPNLHPASGNPYGYNDYNPNTYEKRKSIPLLLANFLSGITSKALSLITNPHSKPKYQSTYHTPSQYGADNYRSDDYMSSKPNSYSASESYQDSYNPPADVYADDDYNSYGIPNSPTNPASHTYRDLENAFPTASPYVDNDHSSNAYPNQQPSPHYPSSQTYPYPQNTYPTDNQYVANNNSYQTPHLTPSYQTPKSYLSPQGIYPTAQPYVKSPQSSQNPDAYFSHNSQSGDTSPDSGTSHTSYDRSKHYGQPNPYGKGSEKYEQP